MLYGGDVHVVRAPLFLTASKHAYLTPDACSTLLLFLQ